MLQRKKIIESVPKVEIVCQKLRKIEIVECLKLHLDKTIFVSVFRGFVFLYGKPILSTVATVKKTSFTFF